MIVSASLGVLLPSLVWSKPSLSAVPPHPHLKKKPMKELSHGPTSLSFHCCVLLHFISLIVPGSRKTEETSVNSWISFKGRDYHKINNWKFTFHESWDLPVTLAMSPITLIPKWPASGDVKGWRLSSSFVIFELSHDTWIGGCSFLTQIHTSPSSLNFGSGCYCGVRKGELWRLLLHV